MKVQSRTSSKKSSSARKIPRSASTLEVLRAKCFANLPWLVHGFSTRQGGGSRCYGERTLNLGFTSEDDKNAVLRNRELFAQALGAVNSKGDSVAAGPDQADTFGHRAARQCRLAQAFIGDGLITKTPELLLVVQTADCVPVLVVDSKQRAVGAFHAGWRGPLPDFEKGVGEMRRQSGSHPGDLRAAIGPCIRRCCYVVGPEVEAEFESQFSYARDVHALLTGPDASVRLVLTPERVVIAEARRTWTSLGLYGFAVDGVVVNRVMPAAAARGDAWRRSWNEAQRSGLVEVAESFAGLPIVRVPYLAGEPIGTDALDALAGLMEGDVSTGDDPLGVLGPVRHDGLRVRRSGSGYVLSLPLPLVNAREVDLKRRDAELLVSVGDHRRVLSLPAALPAVCRPRRPRPGGDAAGDVRAGPRPLAGPGGRQGNDGTDDGMREAAHG